jgi:outer membrane receptor protein involved in Fe transport
LLHRFRHHAFLILCTSLVARAAAGEEPREGTGDFEQLSLDALLNPTITTATKSARTLEQTPSIVSVFGREDIERLGARQLIDLLRYVPGFYEVGSQLERNVAIRGIHASSPVPLRGAARRAAHERLPLLLELTRQLQPGAGPSGWRSSAGPARPSTAPTP